jgi:hypothetical protein
MVELYTRRKFLKTAIAEAVGLTGILSSGCNFNVLSGKKKKPNVVLVISDTTRYDRIGFNGYRASTRNEERLESTTPFLDSIAGQGMVFDNNYCQANFTPFSVGSLFNSSYLNANAINLNTTQAAQRPTLAEALQENGYQTIGAISSSMLSNDFGIGRGFDKYLDTKDLARRGDFTLEELKREFSEIDPEKPVFIFYHTYDPHVSYIDGIMSSNRYDSPSDFKDKFRTIGDFSTEEKNIIGFEYFDKPCIISEQQCMEFSDQYDGQIRFADDNIRRLMGFLSEKEVFDLKKDLFVFAADHGEDLGENGSTGFHDGLDEVVTRTPLLIAGNNIPKGRRVDSLTMNIDIVPTILNNIGIKSHKDYQGKDLIFAYERGKNIRNLVFTQSRHLDAVSVVNSSGIKYIHRGSIQGEIDIRTDNSLSPSGMVEYFEDRFKLVWSKNILEGDDSEPLEIFLRKVDGVIIPNFEFSNLYNSKGQKIDVNGNLVEQDNNLIIGEEDISKDITSHIFKSCLWDTMALYQVVFEWGLRKGEFERKTRFSFRPSPNFCHLIDLKSERDRENLVQNPSYESHLIAMKDIARKYLNNKVKIKDFFESISPEKKDELRGLGYL